MATPPRIQFFAASGDQWSVVSDQWPVASERAGGPPISSHWPLLFSLRGFLRPLRQSCQKRDRWCGRIDFSRQRRFGRDHVAVEIASGVLILLDHCAIEGHA